MLFKISKISIHLNFIYNVISWLQSQVVRNVLVCSTVYILVYLLYWYIDLYTGI